VSLVASLASGSRTERDQAAGEGIPELLTPAIGRQLLDELGFLHVPGPPLTASRAYLFVAIRRKPTLRHFDPERIDYWAEQDGVGAAATIEASTGRLPRGAFAWGRIRIVDRLREGNDYVAFGGRLSVERIDDVTVAVFASEAPILARGGHSQGWDPLAEETSGYDARLRAAFGRDRGLERFALSMSPVALYAAFVADTLAREDAAARVAAWHPVTQALLRREARRLARSVPADWAAGEALIRSLAEARR
jgi:hypothetical protein